MATATKDRDLAYTTLARQLQQHRGQALAYLRSKVWHNGPLGDRTEDIYQEAVWKMYCSIDRRPRILSDTLGHPEFQRWQVTSLQWAISDAAKSMSAQRRDESRTKSFEDLNLTENTGATPFFHNYGPEQAAMAREDATSLTRALAQQSPQRQKAFVGHYLEGTSIAALAEQLGVTPKNVTLLLHRARRALAAAEPIFS